MQYGRPQCHIWPSMRGNIKKTGERALPGLISDYEGLGLVSGRRTRLRGGVLASHRYDDGVFAFLAAYEEPGNEYPEREKSHESGGSGDRKHGQLSPSEFGLVGRFLISSLRSEFFLRRHGHGGALVVVTAQDEPGHYDPESEQSNKGGSGGYGKHLNLSPNGDWASSPVSMEQIMAKGCYAGFAPMLRLCNFQARDSKPIHQWRPLPRRLRW